MTVYRERPALLPGAQVWTLTTPGGDYLVLPDGCMDLLVMDDSLYVAGPDAVAWKGTSATAGEYTGLRFAPGDAPTFLGVPAHHLLNQRIPLADLWSPNRAQRLLDRVRATSLDTAVAELVRTPDDHLNQEVHRRIRANTVGTGGVVGLARGLGVSERQLHRRCLAAFGYGAKTLDRVLRMNLALDRARTGVGFAEAAAVSGYADQAHFTREVKALTGLPPSRLLH